MRLDSAHRGHDEYAVHASKLLLIGLPTVAFLDPAADGIVVPNTTNVVPWQLEDCWLHGEIENVGIPPTDNPGKDTRKFHTVQHAKTQIVAAATNYTDADLLVWIDAGIFHLPDVKPQHLRRFFSHIRKAPRDRVSFASIWPIDDLIDGEIELNYTHPQWWIAGGVFVVPRHMASWLDQVFRADVRDTAAKTGAISWEVNHLAAVCRDYQSKTALWLCGDHDHTLFSFSP